MGLFNFFGKKPKQQHIEEVVVPQTPPVEAISAQYCGQGMLYAQEERYEEAVMEFKKAIEVNPRDAQARNNLGNAFAALGQFEEAIQQYQEAVRIDPQNVNPHLNLGRIHHENKDMDKAIFEYRTALSIDSSQIQALYNLAMAYKERGNRKEALVCYQKFVEVAPREYDAAIQAAAKEIHKLKAILS